MVIASQEDKSKETNKFVSMPEDWGDSLDDTDLSGGEEATGYAVFDVPPKGTGFQLEVRGWAIIEKQVGYIDLGV